MRGRLCQAARPAGLPQPAHPELPVIYMCRVKACTRESNAADAGRIHGTRNGAADADVRPTQGVMNVAIGSSAAHFFC
eukprot:353700-Chlamydomonas_euryale.AAC.4